MVKKLKINKKKNTTGSIYSISQLTKKPQNKQTKKDLEVAYVTLHILRTRPRGHTRCLENKEFFNGIITCPAKLTETLLLK